MEILSSISTLVSCEGLDKMSVPMLYMQEPLHFILDVEML